MTSVYNASLALKDAKNFKELLHVCLFFLYTTSAMMLIHMLIAGAAAWQFLEWKYLSWWCIWDKDS